MKKWTIVTEISTRDGITKGQLEAETGIALSKHFGPDDRFDSFRIMETIEAPYGPELPGGVYLDMREGPKKVRR